MSVKKKFDFILYGATSFVGQIMLEYFSEYKGEEFSWAVAARSEEKIKTALHRVGLDELDYFVADADDEESLKVLCDSATVIVSTVGPYALYGETLLKLCAQTGTAYCDLTGEPQWIKRMLDKYEAQAKNSGARIVHCSGFDSIPSDLGLFYFQNEAIKRSMKPSKAVKMRVRRLKGGASGGTVASMLNVLEEVKKEPSLKKTLVDPYVLCPEEHAFHVRQKNHSSPEYDVEQKLWTMPFVMAAINERVIHRSNALMSNMYGTDFRYDEAMSAKSPAQAWMMTLGLGAFMVGASIPPIQKLLVDKVLPKPGEGPNKKEQTEGMFEYRFYGHLDNAQKLEVSVKGDRDPGYGSTAKMLSQATLCLAKDVNELEGGFWTPASAMGELLIHRLQNHAGVRFELIN